VRVVIGIIFVQPRKKRSTASMGDMGYEMIHWSSREGRGGWQRGLLSEATLQPGQDLLDGHSGHLHPVLVNNSQQGEG